MEGIPTFDIEARNWVHPIAVGLWDGYKYKDFLKESETSDPVWDFLVDLRDNHNGITVFAHNAAHYDNKFILSSLIRNKQKASFSGGMSKLVWLDHDISFEDSYLMLGRKLSALCRAFGVDNKLDWDHKKTVDIWEMQFNRITKFREYLKRDCMALSKCLEEYCKLILDNFNMTPSSTMSLTAVKAFDKNFCKVRSIASNVDYETFIRAATFGGRNEVYNKYGEGVHFYDIRSMYTSCYDTPVPVGKMEWMKPTLDQGGVADAIVSVPEYFNIGPLPLRYKGRLIYPVGKFRGWWDVSELKFAVELGCEVKLLRQCGGLEEPVLKEFGDYVCKLRETAENRDLDYIWKILGLRLVGKLGQNRMRTEIKHVEDIDDLEGWYQIDDRETYFEKVVQMNGNRSPYVKPAINMRIRAEARIRHLKKLLEAQELGELYYCDTDSIYAQAHMKTGNKPGDLQFLNFAMRAYFVRCKFYGYLDRLGKFRQRSSGYKDFKLSEGEFQRLLKGETLVAHFEVISNWKSVLKSQGVELIGRDRTAQTTLRFENRVSSGLTTKPIRLSEPD